MRITRDELMSRIREGSLKGHVMCHGEEVFFHNQIISTLRKQYGGAGSWGFEMVDASALDPARLFSSAGTLSFGGGTKVTVIRNANRLNLSQLSGLEKIITNQSSERVVMFFAEKHLSQKNELLAWCRDKKMDICSLNPPKPRELVGWIKDLSREKGFSTDKETIDFILDISAGNIVAINQMLDKIDLFRGESNKISFADTQDLLNDSFEKKIFDCVNAVFAVRSGKVPRSQLDEVVKERETAALEMQRVLRFDPRDGILNLVRTISREAFNLLKYHELKIAGAGKEEIAKVLRLGASRKWLLERDYPARAARWPKERLHRLMLRLAEVDFSLRVSGRDAGAMLEQIVIGNLAPTSVEEYDEVFL